MILRRIVVASLFLSACGVFGYDNLVIHPKLSSSAAEVYNSQTDKKLTQEQINWIIDGSIAEDTDPRYLNHFYNPSTGGGLSGGVFSGLPAPTWSQTQNSATGDYSESAIIKNYKEGNKKRAYQGIGHMLHLIQDMAVPAHTRNDAHPEGDFYEGWAKQYGLTNLDKTVLTKIDNLNNLFKNLSTYAHNNFFSKDTINEDILNKIEIFKIEKDINGVMAEYGYRDGFKIVRIKKQQWGDEYSFDFRVHLDYWNMLYPQAVGYSAGVIDYFVKQFEAIDAEKQKEIKESGLLDRARNFLSSLGGNIKYGWGDIFIAGRVKMDSILGVANDFSKNTSENIGYFVEANKEVVATTINKISPVSQLTTTSPQILGVKITDTATSSSGSAPQDIISQNTVSQDQIATSSDINISWEQRSGVNIISTTTVQGEIQQTEVIIPQQSNFFIIHAGDSTPPETSMSSSLSSVSSSTSASFVFSSNEAVSGFEYNLDNLGWYSSSGVQNFINLTDGAHILQARAVDSSKNTDPTPAEFTWTVDTISPIVSVVSGPSSFANSTQAVFQFNSSEIATYQCKLDSGAWQICSASTTINSLIDGNHVLEVTGEDLVGHISSSTSYAWVVDTIAPTSSIFSLSDYYSRTGFDVSWLGNDTIASTTDISGVDNYDVQYKIVAGSWQDLAINSSSTSTVFSASVTPGDQVYFQSRAKDKAGNIGDWSAVASTTVGTGHLVISEIQIVGTTATDEFVELFNPTGATVNLSGYRLSRKTSTGTLSNLLTTFPNIDLPAGGFYLIAHPTDYDGGATVDAVYSTVQSIAANNTIILYSDAGATIVDKVGLGTAGEFEGMAVPNPSSSQSIERKIFASSTSESMADGADKWQGNNYDSDNNANDFIIKTIPQPQNIFSPLEPQDIVPGLSATINDLSYENSCMTSSSTKIAWTSPANANISAGAYYDLRYVETTSGCNMQLDWSGANQVSTSSLPAPSLLAGDLQQVDVSGLASSTIYCFAIKTFNGNTWSDISNQVLLTTTCDNLEPFFSGNLIIRRDIANKDTAISTSDESIIVLDFYDSTDRGAWLVNHNDVGCGFNLFTGWGSTSPAARLIVEFLYYNDTKKFTGNYRFCTDNVFNPNIIEGDKCKDGDYWGGARWMGHSGLVDKTEVSVFNLGQYTQWLRP